jgi:hypothetical protein
MYVNLRFPLVIDFWLCIVCSFVQSLTMYLVSRTQLQLLTHLTLKEFTGNLQLNYLHVRFLNGVCDYKYQEILVRFHNTPFKEKALRRPFSY